jgi:hypothetical protein
MNFPSIYGCQILQFSRIPFLSSSFVSSYPVACSLNTNCFRCLCFHTSTYLYIVADQVETSKSVIYKYLNIYNHNRCVYRVDFVALLVEFYLNSFFDDPSGLVNYWVLNPLKYYDDNIHNLKNILKQDDIYYIYHIIPATFTCSLLHIMFSPEINLPNFLDNLIILKPISVGD